MKGPLKIPNLGRRISGGRWCGCRIDTSSLLVLCIFVTFYNCSAAKGTLGGMFGMLKGLVGSKSLSREDMESVLDKMRDHLIGESGGLGWLIYGLSVA